MKLIRFTNIYHNMLSLMIFNAYNDFLVIIA